MNHQVDHGEVDHRFAAPRVSKADGSQDQALQPDALKAARVKAKHIYEDTITGSVDDQPGLDACLKALRKGDVPRRVDRPR